MAPPDNLPPIDAHSEYLTYLEKSKARKEEYKVECKNFDLQCDQEIEQIKAKFSTKLEAYDYEMRWSHDMKPVDMYYDPAFQFARERHEKEQVKVLTRQVEEREKLRRRHELEVKKLEDSHELEQHMVLERQDEELEELEDGRRKGREKVNKARDERDAFMATNEELVKQRMQDHETTRAERKAKREAEEKAEEAQLLKVNNVSF